MKCALHRILFLSVLLLGLGCGEAELPEIDAIENAELDEVSEAATEVNDPIAQSTSTFVPESSVAAGPTATAEPPNLPTAESTEAPTREATAAPDEEPETFALAPLAQAWPVGEAAVVEGTSPKPGEIITVVLHAGPHRLAEGEAVVDDDGRWRAELDVPHNVQGTAYMLAVSQDGQLRENIWLAPGGADPRGIEIVPIQPAPNQKAITGTSLFFSGDVTNVVGRKVNVGFLINNCSEYVAQQEVTLGGDSAFWNGVLILPRVLEDERGCASIITGNPQSGHWRQVLIPMEVVPLDLEGGEPLFVIGNRPDKPLKAGATVTLYGTAVRLPDPTIQIKVVSDEAPNVNVETTTFVNDFGYWEITLLLPPELVGPATVVMTASDGETAVTREAKLTVAP